MAGQKNHSPEDMVRFLQRFGELLAQEVTVELACREIGVSTAMYYKWRQLYDGMRVDDAKLQHLNANSNSYTSWRNQLASTDSGEL